MLHKNERVLMKKIFFLGFVLGAIICANYVDRSPVDVENDSQLSGLIEGLQSVSDAEIVQSSPVMLAFQKLFSSFSMSSFIPQNFYIPQDSQNPNSPLLLNKPVLKKAFAIFLVSGLLIYCKQRFLGLPVVGTGIVDVCQRIGLDPIDFISTVGFLGISESLIAICASDPVLTQEKLVAAFVIALAGEQIAFPKKIAPDECSKALWRALCGTLACTKLGTLLKDPNFELIIQSFAAQNSVQKVS